MFTLTLGGCDVVLGTQWLRTLGPILWDFAELWMQFSPDGHKQTLKGLQPGSLSIISSHRLEKLLKKSSHGVIAQLHSLQMQPSAAPTTPLDLQQILDRYTGVFAEPVGLPPSRPEDHRIHLVFQQGYVNDSSLSQIIQCLDNNPSDVPHYSWDGASLR